MLACRFVSGVKLEFVFFREFDCNGHGAADVDLNLLHLLVSMN